MSETSTQTIDESILLLTRTGQRCVTALRSNDDRSARSRHKTGHAEASAWPKHHRRRAGHSLARAERINIPRPEVRKRPCGRFEIVDQSQRPQSKHLAQLRPIDEPTTVGNHATVAMNWAGYCKTRMRDRSAAMMSREERLNSIGDPRIIAD